MIHQLSVLCVLLYVMHAVHIKRKFKYKHKKGLWKTFVLFWVVLCLFTFEMSKRNFFVFRFRWGYKKAELWIMSNFKTAEKNSKMSLKSSKPKLCLMVIKRKRSILPSLLLSAGKWFVFYSECSQSCLRIWRVLRIRSSTSWIGLEKLSLSI